MDSMRIGKQHMSSGVLRVQADEGFFRVGTKLQDSGFRTELAYPCRTLTPPLNLPTTKKNFLYFYMFKEYHLVWFTMGTKKCAHMDFEYCHHCGDILSL